MARTPIRKRGREPIPKRLQHIRTHEGIGLLSGAALPSGMRVHYVIDELREVTDTDSSGSPPGPRTLDGVVPDLETDARQKLERKDLTLRLSDGREFPIQLELDGRVVPRGQLPDPPL